MATNVLFLNLWLVTRSFRPDEGKVQSLQTEAKRLTRADWIKISHFSTVLSCIVPVNTGGCRVGRWSSQCVNSFKQVRLTHKYSCSPHKSSFTAYCTETFRSWNIYRRVNTIALWTHSSVRSVLHICCTITRCFEYFIMLLHYVVAAG